MIVIIIVNWNGIDDTLECLESLMRLRTENFRVLVMDNGSTQSPVDAVKSWAANGLEKAPLHPSWRHDLAGPRTHEATWQHISAAEPWDDEFLVTLIEIGWNSGFAHANNVGMKLALDNPDVDQIWLLNNDTIVLPDTLNELVQLAESDSRYALIGSTLVYYHHGDLVQAIGASYNLLTARVEQIGNKAKLDELEAPEKVQPKLDFVVGASMFASRAHVESAGLLDDKYFLYFEELDWAKRLRPGKKLGWAPASIVYHKEGASIGTDSVKGNSPLAIFYANRGLPIFYAKWYPWLLPVVALKILFNVTRFALRRDIASTKAAWRGAVSGFFAVVGRSYELGPQNGPPHLNGRASSQ